MLMQANEQPPASRADPGRPDAGWLIARPWAGVIFLMLVGILNYLDRVLPSILAEPIKKELVLSDTVLGLVNGVGFLAIYVLASVPIASQSDRGRYPAVIVFSLGIWSLMTALGGWVSAGWQLALTRSGVALGEAGGMPAAHAFITRHIPASSRTSAFSLFTMCLPLGTMAGFVVGGYFGQTLGWRGTFILMGGVGLVLAVLAWLLLGRGAGIAVPVRHDDAPKPGFLAMLAKRSMIFTLAGAAFVGMGGYTSMAFTPAFLMRSHGLTVGEAGLSFGISGGAVGVVGLILIGWATDRLALRDARWLLGTIIVMILGAMPLSILAYKVSNTSLAMAGLAINLAIAMVYAAPITAALHRLAPVELRARISAMLLLATGILGGFGPLAAGAISDALKPQYGADALGHAMLVVPAAYFCAALCFAAALPSFRREIVIEG
jgi:MFS family permease